MASLSTCLKKAGLAEHEAAILRGARDKLISEDHIEAQVAAVEAVTNYIEELTAERADIVAQIEAQGGVVPKQAASEVISEEPVPVITKSAAAVQTEPAPPPGAAADANLRQHIEALIKRRAAAGQMGKDRAFNAALALAKDALAGEAVNVNRFTMYSKALVADKPSVDALNGIVDALKVPAEQAGDKLEGYTHQEAKRLAKLGDVKQAVVRHPTQPGKWSIVERPKRERSLRQKANDAKLRSVRNNVDIGRDSLFTAIGKLGGMNRDAVVSEWGIDPKDAPSSGVIGKPVLRVNGGWSIDRMAETLGEYGYLQRDEQGKIDLADFEELFGQELRGDKVYTVTGIEDQADRKRADQEAEFLAATAEDEGVDPSAENIADMDLLALAVEIDPDGFERLAISYEGRPDPEFIAAVQELINEHFRRNEAQNRGSEKAIAANKAGTAEQRRVAYNAGQKGFDLIGQTNTEIAAAEKAAKDARAAAEAETKAEDALEKSAKERAAIKEASTKADFALTGTAAVSIKDQKTIDAKAAIDQLAGQNMLFQEKTPPAAEPAKVLVAEVSKPTEKLASEMTAAEHLRAAADKLDATEKPKAETGAMDEYPKAGNEVSGLTVRDSIPNQSSIASSLIDYTVLKGVREVPFSAFTKMGELKYYSTSEQDRTQSLAAQIKESGEINPLIVVIDKDGPYVLEGGHRFDALRELGIKSFPAQVVIDNESLAQPNPGQQPTPRVAESRQAPGSSEVAPGPGNRGVAPTREGGTAGITDFGEKIGGARKDYAETYRDRMKEAASMDIAAEPLSKSWPEPDYQKLLDEKADPWSVAFAHAARDEVPTKPQQSWKLSQWVKNVQLLRNVTNKIMAGELSAERARELLKDSPALKPVSDRAELYMEVGHDKSLKGVRISSGTYGIFNREKFDPPKVIWSVERKTKTTAMSRWPEILSYGSTRAEAIANFKKAWAETPVEQEAKAIEFDIYSRRGTGVFFIGKKIGKNVVTLKDGFTTAKEARVWKAANQAELVKTLEKIKEVPNERRESNSPRVGEDHRNGADVTPAQFSETFGFRGVEFGNYVEGVRRQADLNEAYDALMDLAGVLGVPIKALSLNGELGLAFGARGMGGRTAGGRAAAAHYEPGKIVINLTKERGAGSLAHEWFHAVDNYFSRMRGDKSGFVTGTPGARGEGMRTEMLAAFNRVMDAVRSSGVRERSIKLDQARYNPYWGLGHEMAARSFESYVIAKLHDQNASNDYLANIVSQKYWDAAASLAMEKEGTYPYPADADMPKIRAAFDDFFKTVETRETDKGVAMFSKGQPGVEWFTGPLQIDEANREKTDALQADLKANNGVGVKITPVVMRDTDTQDVQGRAGSIGQGNYFRLAEELSRIFGKQIVWVEVEGNSFNGIVQNEGPLSKYVFINARSPIPAHVILGHELTHHIEKDAPGIYRALKLSLTGLLKNHAEYRKSSPAFSAASDEELSEEMIGDLMGDNFDKREFWNRVAKESKGTFRMIASRVMKWLDALVQKLGFRTLGYGSEQFVTDIHAARRALAQAVVDYAESQKQKVGKEWTDIAGEPRLSRADQTQMPGRAAQDEGGLNQLLLMDRASGLTRNAESQMPDAMVTQRAGALRFSRAGSPESAVREPLNLIQQSRGVANAVATLFRSPDQLSMLNAFQTPFHKANMLARKGIPGYKRVFERLQLYLNDTARFATQAEQLMPSIMRELKGITPKAIRQYFKAAASEADIQAIGPWLNHGTLYGGGSPLQGVVWTDDELRGRETFAKPIPRELKPLTEAQIPLYRQARSGINHSIQTSGKAVIYRHVAKYGITVDRDASLASVAADVRNQLETKITEQEQVVMDATARADAVFQQSEARKEAADSDRKNREARVLADNAKAAYDKAQTALDRAQGELDTLRSLYGETDKEIARKEEINSQVQQKALREEIDYGTIRGIQKHAQDLIDHGYMPLKRFGTKTVTAKDKTGKSRFFGTYDGKPLVPGSANKEMNEVAAEIKALHPDWTVVTGTRSEKAWQMYQGLSMDALENFLDFLDPETKAELEHDKTIQEYLKNAVMDRSVLKELIHRKGTPGFSTDVPRILASFITSHARNASGLYHLGEAKRLVGEIPDQYGTVKDEANDLVKYVAEPGEEAAKLRSFLFFNFLGGSVAAAAINLTQTVLTTGPYLSQYIGASKLVAAIGRAAKAAVKDPSAMEGALGRDLQRAELEGVTAPQQIFHLAAMASNNPFSSDRRFRTIMAAWSGMFGAAEVFNRRIAFIAAHDIYEAMTPEQRGAAKKADGSAFTSAYDFAKEAVDQTQYIYNRGNRMNLGRGAIGATILTFKTFSISTLELLRRLPPQQQLMMLGVLLLMAGAEGLPFEEDISDLVDTLGQWLGFTTNTGKWTGKAIRNTLGPEWERPILKGLGGMLPIDLHSRLGMPNLIPGTALFKQSEIDKTRDVAEAIGPFGSVLKNMSDGLQLLARGRWDKAAVTIAPKAARDFYNGANMGFTGESEDTKGRLAMRDVTAGEAFGKFIGFNPQRAGREGEFKREEMVDKNLRRVRMDEIASDWADGITGKDEAKVKSAMNRFAEWNRDNPELRIEGAQMRRSIVERVQSAQRTSAERFIKSLPKPMKPEAREALR